ncbi:MAG: hypothetical protein J6L76_04115 [Clostridia bacterium]|nr:hypothetical protein [Clostridia bacterium]
MDDWRLNRQKNDFSDQTLYKITFPDFWKTAYKHRNAFFQRIEQNAKKYVESSNSGHEFLEGERIQHFWHEHCTFCWEKALTDKECIFYCNGDMQHWVCEECFHDFKEKFNWEEKSAEDLPL